MRMSQLFGRRLREAPADAEHRSHQLLLRAGLVQQTAAGIYSYLPLGLRVQRKIDQIVREEMDRAGGQEVLMPALSPSDLWDESGRRTTLDSILFTVTDRRERELVLGPTHEEVVVDLFRRNVQSYKELPLLLYQIQTKFRDEARPRMGLVRGREFGMMDLYSFHADAEDLDRVYQSMHDAYVRVFRRAGVPAIAVFADSGAIGGKDSQEFMLVTDIGEDELLLCPSCGYGANTERAGHRRLETPAEAPTAIEDVHTPGQKTIDDLVAFLGVSRLHLLKTVLYMAGAEPIMVAIRGDEDVNETKLRNALKALDLRLMTDEDVRASGLVAGFVSPAGVTGLHIVADESALSANLTGGANRPDYHTRNLNHGRDWQAGIVADISLARPGDGCVSCGAPLEQRRGIEMGHIFKLGAVYSEKMGATFLDVGGQEQVALMGCYGIGTSRLLQCVIEANHDDAGIIWPVALAPFDVHVVAIGLDRPDVSHKAETLVDALESAGLDVLFDDRPDVSAGVKFNDADLVGVPLRVTISARSLANQSVEVKHRASGEVEHVPYDRAVSFLTSGAPKVPGLP